MIDIHSHLLPNIDDGSRSPEQSIDVLKVLAQQGVRDVIFTPHVSASEIACDPDDPLERRAIGHSVLSSHQLPRTLTTHLGFEIMLDQPLPDRATEDRRFSLAGSRYLLVEFPYSVVAQFARTVLAEIAKRNAVPIVAHPERYDVCSPDVVREWRLAGAKIQLDATTLTRPSTRGHRARRLLMAGLADVIAADNHGDARSLVSGVRYLEDRGAARQASLLSAENPSAVISDGDMMDVPGAPLRETFIERWRRLSGG